MKALVKMHNIDAGILERTKEGYLFIYLSNYSAEPISLTLPVRKEPFIFKKFPPLFDGLLPEGPQLEGLLKERKIDRNNLMAQLIAVGEDLVGAITVHE